MQTLICSQFGVLNVHGGLKAWRLFGGPQIHLVWLVNPFVAK
jgi:hypothetical protein